MEEVKLAETTINHIGNISRIIGNKKYFIIQKEV